MNSRLQSNLNTAINNSLKALAASSARNFLTLDKALGSQPLAWTNQLSTDLEQVWEEYKALLDESVREEKTLDMRQVTTALEKILTTAFCLQIVTRSASPRVQVVQN
jgi:hypothetical protein